MALFPTVDPRNNLRHVRTGVEVVVKGGLRTKVFGSLLLIALVSLALVYVLISRIYLASQEEEEISRASSLVRILATGMRPIDLEDQEAVNAVLTPLKKDEGVAGLFLLRATGVPVNEMEEAPLGALLPIADVMLFLASSRNSMLFHKSRGDGTDRTFVAAYAEIEEEERRGRPWVLFLVMSASQRLARVEISNQFVLLSVGLGLLVVLVIGYLALGRMIVTPMESLVRVTRKAGSEAIPGDEIAHVENALGRMREELEEVRLRVQMKDRERKSATRRLKTAEQSLERSEKLASVGVLTAGFAHEIGNPMGVLVGYLELLEEPECTEEERLEFLRRMKDAVGAMDGVLRQLLRYSRPSPRQEGLECSEVHSSLNAVTRLLALETRFRGVDVHLTEVPDGVWVEAESGRLEQVFMNLLLNAADAMEGTGRVEVFFEESGPYWQIHLQDGGPGVPEESLSRLFDPFYSTKPEGVGTGLGLAISRQIVNSFGGDIHVKNTEGKGARFTVRLYRFKVDVEEV
jgi:two-component system NtrC family sensor kinase